MMVHIQVQTNQRAVYGKRTTMRPRTQLTPLLCPWSARHRRTWTRAHRGFQLVSSVL